MEDAKKTIKTFGIMVLATLLAKISGMAREIIFASLYGTGGEAAAFLTASRIPLLFFDITLGAAISSSFIPVFNDYLQKEEKEKAIRYANTFITIIVLITGVLCALGIIFAGPIASFVGSGLGATEKALAAELVSILFPTMIFTALAYAITGILQSYGEFNIPASISLVSNLIMVVYLLVVGDKLGIHGVAVAMLLAWSFQVIVQLPSLYKKNFRYRPLLDVKSDGMKKTVALALPILISSWVQPINSTVNTIFATFLNEGRAVAALDYANKLYIIFVGVITYAISNLIFPSISRYAAGDKNKELADTIGRAVKIVIAIILPVMILFLILRTPIVRLVYERGEFGPESTMLTASALFFYSFGMVGFGISEIINKAFYATKDGKTPMIVAMIGICINIGLSVFFVRGLSSGLWGLALAASIAANLIGITLLIILNRRLTFLRKKDYVNILKLCVAGIIMGVLICCLYSVLPFGTSFMGTFCTLFISGLCGVLLYVCLLFLFKTEEAELLLGLIKKDKKKVM